MNKRTIILRGLISVFVFLISIFATAETLTVGNLNFDVNVNTKEAEVTGASSNSIVNLSIPDEVTYNGESYPVTSIKARAFQNKTGFRGYLTLSNNLKTINDQAFEGCTGLVGALVVPNTVTKIGNNAFKNCSALNGKLTIGNSVESIGQSAFEGCKNLTGALTIPNTVKTIGAKAFSGDGGFTGKLTIPSDITVIEESVFNGCSRLTGTLIIPEGVTEIKQYAFQDCSGFIGSLVIPDKVETIGYNAFKGCNRFSGSLRIPDSVVTIDYGAFFDCTGFSGNLIVGNSVAFIEGSAFHGCKFTDVYLPASLLSVNTWAFYLGTEDKQTVTFTCEAIIPPALLSTMGTFDFYTGHYGILYVPAESLSRYRAEGSGWDVFSQILPIGEIISIDGVKYRLNPETKEATVIGYVAGELPANLVIPSTIEYNGETYTVTGIGNDAFKDCKDITSVTIPETVKSIGSGAFSGCDNLKEIHMLGTEPPIIEDDSFGDFDGTIYVPDDAKEDYEKDSGWGNHKDDIAGESTTVIENVSVISSKEENHIYTVDGNKIAFKNIKDLPKGLYIVNNKKLIIK